MNKIDTCKRCADCEGQYHHWMEDESERQEGEMVFACKHCDFEASSDESTFLETVGTGDVFFFVCEGCGEAGEITIPHAKGMGQFNCPEECGASYIRWNDPIKGQPALQCVVCPVLVE